MQEETAALEEGAHAHTACVICTAPRTGSSLLGEALASTDLVGRPREYFDIHARNERTWIDQLGIARDEDYLEKVIAAGTTPNGVFGLKLHWHQIPALIAKFASASGVSPASPNAALDDALRSRFATVHYLWLRRRNTVAQGISYYRASQSEVWRVRADDARPDAAASVPFDFAKVNRFVRLIEDFDRNWHDFFRRKKIKPLVLFYEDVAVNYENIVRAVCDYVGVRGDRVAVRSHAFRQQADSLSLDWEREYRRMQEAQPDAADAHKRRARLAPAGSSSAEPPVARASLRTGKPAAPGSSPADAKSAVVLYDVNPQARFRIVPASADRLWLRAMPDLKTDRRAPLIAANRHGWFILNPCRLALRWSGKPTADSLTIEYAENDIGRYASSELGDGIVTFSFTYRFRAPAGIGLYVKGPANMPKDGVCPLEGIVGADPTTATLTMNWKMTRADHSIFFEQNEPIATVFPIAQGQLPLISDSISDRVSRHRKP